MVLIEARPSLWLAALVVAIFAVFHGHAHGREFLEGTSALLYSLGFVIVTGLLHAVGILLGFAHRWEAGRRFVQTAGGGVALAGSGMRPGRTIAGVLATLAPGAAAPAQAHLVETGFGAFYDGIAHLALTPADLLLVIALGLLAGQRGTPIARRTLFALPLAWLAGRALGRGVSIETTLPLVTILSFGVAGVPVAFDARLRTSAIAGFAVAAGLVHGYVNGAAMQVSGSPACSG
jgi:hydrogenase/urease accessory protein HupE